MIGSDASFHSMGKGNAGISLFTMVSGPPPVGLVPVRKTYGAQLGQAVERARIIIENLFLDWIQDQIAGAENVNRIDFARRIGVTIIGADNDVVFSGITQYVLEIIIGFGRDVDIEFFEGQLGEPL